MLLRAKQLCHSVACAVLGLGLVQQVYAFQCNQNIGCASCSATCATGKTCCNDCACSSCRCWCADSIQCKSGS
jgi:hypothetical protein